MTEEELMSWKSKNQKRASKLASLAHQLDRRGDTVLRDQAVRELRGVLAHYPVTHSTREYRGEWVTVVYRLPSGAKTTNIWTAIEKWRTSPADSGREE